MTHRLALDWPDPAPFAARGGSILLLAVSDELDPALDHLSNREALGPVDFVVGCGDLDADHLCFLADAFGAPLVHVLGNHDRGARWAQGAPRLPAPVASITEEAGIAIVGLSWPGHDRPDLHARHDDLAAWTDVLGVGLRLLARRVRARRASPVLVISHAAPRGLGDGPDRYHAGFGAYRWLLRRVRPPLWLHGHTHPASAASRETRADGTIILNVTGSVLVELRPPAADFAS